jgi:dTDP-glucose 4,6-dehydratase/UDP-glucuronate decarboxylase
MLLATNDDANGEVVNVGNSQEVTILQLAKRIKEITKCKSPLEFYPLPKDDPKRRRPDTNKLTRLVKWKPQVEFEDGLTRTIEWFLSQTPNKQYLNKKYS